MRRADHSSGGILSIVVCLSVHLETSNIRRPRSIRAVESLKKKTDKFWTVSKFVQIFRMIINIQ